MCGRVLAAIEVVLQKWSKWGKGNEIGKMKKIENNDEIVTK